MVERQLPKLDTRVRFPSPALGSGAGQVRFSVTDSSLRSTQDSRRATHVPQQPQRCQPQRRPNWGWVSLRASRKLRPNLAGSENLPRGVSPTNHVAATTPSCPGRLTFSYQRIDWDLVSLRFRTRGDRCVEQSQPLRGVDQIRRQAARTCRSHCSPADGPGSHEYPDAHGTVLLCSAASDHLRRKGSR
jgi:hypothetical protein